ncbi:MAG: GPR endopeptidase [Oscillospiraceae bacterium]|nr:GPR endopeptidase [Oscillospiraceae bacterium]
MNRTDLALEILPKENYQDNELTEGTIEGVNYTRINLNEEGSRAIGKPPGIYITLFCNDGAQSAEKSALEQLLSPLIPKGGNVLVAGLGNENITPDSLGVRAVKNTVATAHFSALAEFEELSMRKVYVVETGVLAQTGIESALQLKYICDGIKPQLVIAVDSLACMDIERLGKTIQIADSGIAPGSGVKNARHEISEKTLNVPVLAIGVPTVADTANVTKDNAFAHTIIVPREIDMIINRYARTIGSALNRILNPTLSDEEFKQLTNN